MAGEANTPQARQRHAGRALEQRRLVAGAGQDRRDGPRRPAADDRDVGPSRGARLSAAGRRPEPRPRVALAERGRGRRSRPARPARSASTSASVRPRRTDSGTSWRVYAVPGEAGGRRAMRRTTRGGPDQVVDDDAAAGDTGHLERESGGLVRFEVMDAPATCGRRRTSRSGRAADRPSPTCSSKARPVQAPGRRRGRLEHLGPAVDARHARSRAPPRDREQRERDVGAAGPDVDAAGRLGRSRRAAG